MKNRWLIWASVLVVVLTVTGVAAAQTPPEPQPTITDVVVNDPRFSKLERAVIAAGLADDLAGPGPYTVFAPTDAAFAVFDPDTLDDLIASPSTALTDILLYHIIAGEVPSSQMPSLRSVTALQGSEIYIDVILGEVSLNEAAVVTQADIQASNGIVHVIDVVLLPSTEAINPRGYPLEPSLIIPADQTKFSIGEEIALPIPVYDFPDGANGSYLIQMVQYPAGVNGVSVTLKSAQHWASSGETYVLGAFDQVYINVPTYFTVTPYTYDIMQNLETGMTHYVYTPIADAPTYYSEQISFTP